jgi:glycerophosphoryl diester phosphodiesterase
MLRNLNVLQNDRFGTAWNYKKLINDMSDKNNIDSEILMTILLIEEFNRGSICHQLQEKFLVSLFPGIVLKKDMSLGLGQIKLSTASRLLDVSKGEALPLLMNPIKNIEICARYLALLLKQYNEFIDQYNKALDVNSAMNPISKKDKSVLSLGGYIIQYDFDEFDYIAKNYLGTINYKQYEGLLYAAIIRNRVKYRRFNDMIRAKPQNMR